MMKLSIDKLTLERGSRRLIEGLSVTVAAGEALEIRGPNGTGKTTLLRAIAGFLAPSEGTITLAGGVEDATVGEQCHFIGYLNGVRASLTVAENARFWADFLGDGREPDEALDRLGLAALADIPTRYLSAGQRRRLGLARLLLADRPLWLLDEPTVSLDQEGVAALAAIAATHLDKGGLIVAATHLPLAIRDARELRLQPLERMADTPL